MTRSDRVVRYDPKNHRSVVGDFRTAETTIATLALDHVLEVRMVAHRPPWNPEVSFVACFAFDTEVAREVARELRRTISTYTARKVEPRGPILPNTETLEEGEMDAILFTEGDAPHVRVDAEQGGDRIWIYVGAAHESLQITVQLGGAIALWKFFAEGALAPGTRFRWT
ncbi:MAG TPA: hypothetical protein VHO06_09480 [Polyangia bacterium]|nr:hypothetical protein [Polyangia bacterium]